MSSQIRVKPGKSVSAVGLVAGLLFVVLGLVFVIPLFGTFGVVWTCMAGLIAIYYAVNLFSGRGLSVYNVDIESKGDFGGKLRELDRLRADGLLSEDEYQGKRAEILRQRW
jgi:hypothetical protein